MAKTRKVDHPTTKPRGPDKVWLAYRWGWAEEESNVLLGVFWTEAAAEAALAKAKAELKRGGFTEEQEVKD